MGEEVDAALIKKVKVTQEVLGNFIRRPPLTEKHLMKPPFRFIHDIVMAVIDNTGFFNGLFEPSEMDASTITTRETKTAFMQKLIDCLRIATGEECDVKISKILAGQEPGKTNDLLICLGNALAKGVNSDKAVQTLTGKRLQGKGGAGGDVLKEKKKVTNATAAAKLKESSPYSNTTLKKPVKAASKPREDASRSKAVVDGGKGRQSKAPASRSPPKAVPGKPPGNRQVSVDKGGPPPAAASKSSTKLGPGGSKSTAGKIGSTQSSPAVSAEGSKGTQGRKMSGAGILDETEPGSLGSGDAEEIKVSMSRRGSTTLGEESRLGSRYGREGRGTPRRGSQGGGSAVDVTEADLNSAESQAADAEKAEFMGELEFLLKKHGLGDDEEGGGGGDNGDQVEDEQNYEKAEDEAVEEKAEEKAEDEPDPEEPDEEHELEATASRIPPLVNNEDGIRGDDDDNQIDNLEVEDLNNNDMVPPADQSSVPPLPSATTTNRKATSRDRNNHDRVVGSNSDLTKDPHHQPRKSSSSSRSSGQTRESASSVGSERVQLPLDGVVDNLLASSSPVLPETLERADNPTSTTNLMQSQFPSTALLSVSAALGSVSPPLPPGSSSFTKSSSSVILPDINEKPAQRPPSARPHTSQMRPGGSSGSSGPIPRPPSARPAPPRPKTALLVDKDEPAFRPTTAKVANVLLDNEDGDDDSNFIVHEITPASKTTDLQLSDQLDLGFARTTPGAGHMDDNIDMILDPDQRGLLVNQILDSQSKLEDGSKLIPGHKKTDIERDSLLGEKDRMRLREITAGEVDKLKNLMQLMARNANPLGKLMDFVQEDVDAMQRDLNKWREESRKLDAALEAAQEETEKSLEPLRRKMAELDEAIQDRHDSIAATKMSIYRQEERIRKVLLGLDKVKPRAGGNEPKITSADLKNILDDDYSDEPDGDKAYFKPTINNFNFNSTTMSPI